MRLIQAPGGAGAVALAMSASMAAMKGLYTTCSAVRFTQDYLEDRVHTARCGPRQGGGYSAMTAMTAWVPGGWRPACSHTWLNTC
jgi:hypothetical protein